MDGLVASLLISGPEVLVAGTWEGQQHIQHGRLTAVPQMLSQSAILPPDSYCLWLILAYLALLWRLRKACWAGNASGGAVQRAFIHWQTVLVQKVSQ